MSEVVSQLPHLDPLKTGGGLGFGVVFLLTPSFASWLDSGHEFLPTALRHLCQRQPRKLRSFEVQSVAAIVDAIPSPGGNENIKTFSSGHEGVAVLVTSGRLNTKQRISSAIENFRLEEDEEALITFNFWRKYDPVSQARRKVEASRGQPVPLEARASIGVGSASTQRSSIVWDGLQSSIETTEEADSQPRPISTSQQSKDSIFSTVGDTLNAKNTSTENGVHSVPSLDPNEQYRVPLANTLFQNGKRFTMYKDFWEVKFDYTHHEWAIERRSHEDGLGRREQSHLTIGAIQRSSTKRIPLTSLTMPRQVISAYGNVISRLSEESETKDGFPASSELETSVPAFIRHRNVQPGVQVQVFALVTPKDRRSSAQLPPEACFWERGSRLHRVTSGGGGWGQKAGLLSLDPAVSLYPQMSSAHNIFPSGAHGAYETSSYDMSISNPQDMTASELQNTSGPISRETNKVNSHEVSELSQAGTIAVGDEVQFFAAIKPESSDAERERILRKGYVAARDTLRVQSAPPRAKDIVLGTITPRDHPQHDHIPLLGHVANAQGHLAVFPGFFGMLTEKSMSVHFTAPKDFGNSGRHRQNGHSSMIGMPFASVVVETEPPRSVQSDPTKVIHEYLKRSSPPSSENRERTGPNLLGPDVLAPGPEPQPNDDPYSDPYSDHDLASRPVASRKEERRQRFKQIQNERHQKEVGRRQKEEKVRRQKAAQRRHQERDGIKGRPIEVS